MAAAHCLTRAGGGRRRSCGAKSILRLRCRNGSLAPRASCLLGRPRGCPSITGPCSPRTCSPSCRTPAAGLSSSRPATACGCPWTLSSMALSPRGFATSLLTATLSSSTAPIGVPPTFCRLPLSVPSPPFSYSSLPAVFLLHRVLSCSSRRLGPCKVLEFGRVGVVEGKDLVERGPRQMNLKKQYRGVVVPNGQRCQKRARERTIMKKRLRAKEEPAERQITRSTAEKMLCVDGRSAGFGRWMSIPGARDEEQVRHIVGILAGRLECTEKHLQFVWRRIQWIWCVLRTDEGTGRRWWSLHASTLKCGRLNMARGEVKKVQGTRTGIMHDFRMTCVLESRLSEARSIYLEGRLSAWGMEWEVLWSMEWEALWGT